MTVMNATRFKNSLRCMPLASEMIASTEKWLLFKNGAIELEHMAHSIVYRTTGK